MTNINQYKVVDIRPKSIAVKIVSKVDLKTNVKNAVDLIKFDLYTSFAKILFRFSIHLNSDEPNVKTFVLR